MRYYQYIFSVVVFCLGSVNLRADISTKSFTASINCEKTRRFQFVFVTGFLNELMPLYFSDQILFLKKCGVVDSEIKLLRPRSTRSFVENAKVIQPALESLLIKGSSKPMVVVAHSKGAMEVLESARLAPKFYYQHVAGMFLLQANYGGSPIANYVVGYGDGFFPIFDFAIRSALRFLLTAFGTVENLLHEKITDGLYSMTTSYARGYYGQMTGAHVDSFLKLMGRRVLGIQASEDEANANLILQVPAHYLSWVKGVKSDGLVPLSAQTFPKAFSGLPQLHMQMGHFDSVLSQEFSARESTLRIGLMQSMLAALE